LFSLSGSSSQLSFFLLRARRGVEVQLDVSSADKARRSIPQQHSSVQSLVDRCPPLLHSLEDSLKDRQLPFARTTSGRSSFPQVSPSSGARKTQVFSWPGAGLLAPVEDRIPPPSPAMCSLMFLQLPELPSLFYDLRRPLPRNRTPCFPGRGTRRALRPFLLFSLNRRHAPPLGWSRRSRFPRFTTPSWGLLSKDIILTTFKSGTEFLLSLDCFEAQRRPFL